MIKKFKIRKKIYFYEQDTMEEFSFFDIFSSFEKIFEFYNYLKIIIPFISFLLLIWKLTSFIKGFFAFFMILYNFTKRIREFLKKYKFLKKDSTPELVVPQPELVVPQPELVSKTRFRKSYKLVESFQTYDEAFNRMKLELDGEFYHFR